MLTDNGVVESRLLERDIHRGKFKRLDGIDRTNHDVAVLVGGERAETGCALSRLHFAAQRVAMQSACMRMRMRVLRLLVHAKILFFQY